MHAFHGLLENLIVPISSKVFHVHLRDFDVPFLAAKTNVLVDGVPSSLANVVSSMEDSIKPILVILTSFDKAGVAQAIKFHTNPEIM